MSRRLEIRKRLVSHTQDRVKCVDLHPTEPWVLAAFYHGKAVITNHKTQQVVKTFDVCDQPVRSAKFIARKRWVVTISDDLMLRVFNYNTSEREKQFEAHDDYIRGIEVHPTKPYVLTCSDDYTIRMWDWEQNWTCVRIFEGHNHYVMGIALNPKDPSTFASASLDGTVRVWSINSSTPNFVLNGHSREVNCVAYYHGSDRPLIASGSDDQTVKVWDYQTKQCIQTLEGHSDNVTAVCFHPRLPYIVSGGEDDIVNIWNSNTYKLEESFNQGFERVWSVGISDDTKLAIGYDTGVVVLKMGRENPVVSMDKKGKIVLVQGNDVQALSIKVPENINDGEKIVLPSKDLGTTDVTPRKVMYDHRGRMVAVVGEGDYTINNAITFKNRTFGSGEDFVWGIDSGVFGVRTRSGKITVFDEFKEKKSFKTYFVPRQLFGGHLLAATSEDSVCLFEWKTGTLVRSLDILPKAVFWNDKGDLAMFACESSYFILRFDLDLVRQAIQSGTVGEDGVEDCVELYRDGDEKIKDGQWIGDCFVYINSQNRLNYIIGNDTATIVHLEKTYFFLGYVPKHNRVFLMDKSKNVVSYQLHVSVMQYEAAIISGDFDAAAAIMRDVPPQFHNKIARFLDKQDQKELALSVTTDPDHKFDLALETDKFEVAHEIAKAQDSPFKWKQLGAIALSKCQFKLAEECMKAGEDYSGLLLLYSSIGHRENMQKLAESTTQEGKLNVAFMCFFLLGDVCKCIDVLCDSGRVPEAAFFARTYAPSEMSRVVGLWKDGLGKVNERVADAIADPGELPNLFQDLEYALSVESELKKHNSHNIPASQYNDHKQDTTRDLIAEWKSNGTISGHNKEAKAEEEMSYSEEMEPPQDTHGGEEEEHVNAADNERKDEREIENDDQQASGTKKKKKKGKSKKKESQKSD